MRVVCDLFLAFQCVYNNLLFGLFVRIVVYASFSVQFQIPDELRSHSTKRNPEQI
jgi:hypothetical protein